ncbi:unnamed protein product [Phytophthora fragariaefolia]|uniref:Unnamed protein product n=1 Tax=Phytophthora fragariaefolia TaxID=1490495 RepID=A0A9W6U4A3_9STRA|nr:unnamed protein product [Phytophthora fragariaefolia]
MHVRELERQRISVCTCYNGSYQGSKISYHTLRCRSDVHQLVQGDVHDAVSTLADRRDSGVRSWSTGSTHSDRLDVPVSTHQSKDFFGEDTSCSFRMSTPTTQAAGTPAASAAANTVVASSATTGSSPASTSVVTSTVTTPSSPKRTMSLGDYKKTREHFVARDELEAIFDVGSDADMEDGEEEDEGTSSSTRVDPSVGSCRPREDDPDASSSKRARSGSDRPLADAGPLSSPRSGGDSTSSGTVVPRTGPVRDPWMPTPSEIQSRFGSTAPPSQYALYSCSGIKYDDVTKELDFDPATDQRRDYYIGLFHELRWYGNKKTSRRSRVPEWQALCQSWGAFVENFNKDPAGYRERVRLARERYERFSKRPKIDRLRWGAVEAVASVRLAVGVEAAGRRRWSGPPDSVDRLEAVEHLQTAEFAALRQELAMLKAQLAQVSQTASNVQVDRGSELSVLRACVGALEQASALWLALDKVYCLRAELSVQLGTLVDYRTGLYALLVGVESVYARRRHGALVYRATRGPCACQYS